MFVIPGFITAGGWRCEDRRPANISRCRPALARDPAVLQKMLTQVRQEDDACLVEAARVVAGPEELGDALAPAEQARLVRLLVARVDYDGARGKVAMSFHPAALQALAADVATRNQEEQKV